MPLRADFRLADLPRPFAVIVGPVGSGKSTAARLLATLFLIEPSPELTSGARAEAFFSQNADRGVYIATAIADSDAARAASARGCAVSIETVYTWSNSPPALHAYLHLKEASTFLQSALGTEAMLDTIDGLLSDAWALLTPGDRAFVRALVRPHAWLAAGCMTPTEALRTQTQPTFPILPPSAAPITLSRVRELHAAWLEAGGASRVGTSVGAAAEESAGPTPASAQPPLDEHNLLVMRTLTHHLREKRKCVVFATREECQKLVDLLPTYLVDYRAWQAHGDTDTRAVVQEYMSHPGPCVLFSSSPDMWEGADLSDTDAAFLFETPEHRTYRQQAGRFRRLGAKRLTHIYNFSLTSRE
jgi:hypothetical protein